MSTYASCFFLRQQEYDENPDYEHVKQQFMNLKAAQRSIIKKADDGPVQAAPYSTAKIQKSLNELKQGIYHLSVSCCTKCKNR